MNGIKTGMKTIGLSDHNRALLHRYPDYGNLNKYFLELNMLKNKYKGKVQVLAGVEINLNFENPYEEESMPFDIFNTLDYVLLEHVEGTTPYKPITPYCIKLRDLCRIRQKIKVKAGLAHTSLLELSQIYSEGRGLEYGMDLVIGMIKEYDLFWELNVDKGHKYFDFMLKNWCSQEVKTLFRKLKKNKIEMHAGSDIHWLGSYNRERIGLANLIAAYELLPGGI